MGDKDTLVNYYKWVLNNFESNHIYLHFSNHGGGTRSVPISYSDEYGIMHELNTQEGRAMCWDDGSSGSFLKSKDLPLALKEAGIPKVDIIIEDVCLGANIEEAYEIKDCANYLLASPNVMPGNGLDYINIFRYGFLENIDAKLFGYFAVDLYKEYYEMDETRWQFLIKKSTGRWI